MFGLQGTKKESKTVLLFLKKEAKKSWLLVSYSREFCQSAW
jgi:hypothetical protein